MSKILKMENGCPVIVDIENDELVEIENQPSDKNKKKRRYRVNPKPFRGVNKTDNGKWRARYFKFNTEFTLGTFNTRVDAKKALDGLKRTIRKMEDTGLITFNQEAGK